MTRQELLEFAKEQTEIFPEDCEMGMFLMSFIKEHEQTQAIIDELKHSEINGLWKPNYKEGFNDGISLACKVIENHL